MNFFDLSSVPPRLPDYAALVAALKEGKLVRLDCRKDCNLSVVVMLKTPEQLIQVIDTLFTSMRATHEAFRKIQQESMVCDGMIFGMTHGRLETAIQTGAPESKYDYIRAFGFSCSGVFVEIVNENPDPHRPLSEYPFGERSLLCLSRV